MRPPLSISVSVATIFLSVIAFIARAAPVTGGVNRSYMDPTAQPCKDFYTYANGAFDKVPIPGEYAAYGVNQEIDERNFAVLKEILETAAKQGGAKGSVSQRVGDFYASG